MVKDFTYAIETATATAIPRTRTTTHSKPWWTPELRDLRRKMGREYRALRAAIQTPTRLEKEGYLIARNAYFLAIKNAKR